MAVGSAPGPAEQTGHDEPPPSAAPVRRVDDERWYASWDRFQAAHDEHDADLLSGNGHPEPAEPSLEPTPAPDAAPPPAVPAPPPPPVQAASPAPALSTAAELTSQTLLRAKAATSASGWRRLVHRISGGSVNPGLSKEERFQRDRLQRITTPVRGCHRIAVVSLKGGVGKTTTAACLGLTLAHYRGDRVVAVDANPDSGTLAERLVGSGGASVTDLLDNASSISSFTEMAAYTLLAERLQVLGSDQDPHSSKPFDEASYRATDEILSRFFTIVLVDSGSGLLHPAMAGTLALADSLVVVAGPTVDGASRAAKTLDWLVAHGHGPLVAQAVAVITSIRPDAGEVNVDVLRNHLAARCREVVEIPYDPHLATGGRIDRLQLRRQTADAYVSVAAAVAGAFSAVPR
ncbi:MAG: AAA family ATPase [Actinomycetota bacterium]|nr:AAA family ATPase [Actinomycetota bacterium]